jgi:hypothetical protein
MYITIVKYVQGKQTNETRSPIYPVLDGNPVFGEGTTFE